jgi:hypothetical protein
MTINNFIPAIWAARLLENLNNAHVFADLCNRDYEGEIKAVGDTVKINSIGHVTIGDYTKNTNLGDPETLTDAQSTLLINLAKDFNFQVDDVDKAQGKPGVMNAAMDDAAWGLSDAIDKIIAAFHTLTPAANKIGADAGSAKFGTVLTVGSSMYDYLVDMGVLLDQNNTPKKGRWVVLPPWAHGVLQKDSRFVAATQSGTDILQNGVVGRAAGFDIRVSNNVTNDAQTVPTYRIMAGYPGTISYAEQLSEVIAYRPEKRFADAVKGLLLAGAKVVRPANLVTLYAKNAAS